MNETKSPYMQHSRHDDGRMTREEAIKIINCYDIGFYDLSGEKIPADKLAEAFDMAIEALSQPIVAKHFDIQSGYIYCSPQDAENVKVVVRCKDCRQYIPYDLTEAYGWCCKYKAIVEEDDYCSHGERQCNYFGERREK